MRSREIDGVARRPGARRTLLAAATCCLLGAGPYAAAQSSGDTPDLTLRFGYCPAGAESEVTVVAPGPAGAYARLAGPKCAATSVLRVPWSRMRTPPTAGTKLRAWVVLEERPGADGLRFLGEGLALVRKRDGLAGDADAGTVTLRPLPVPKLTAAPLGQVQISWRPLPMKGVVGWRLYRVNLDELGEDELEPGDFQPAAGGAIIRNSARTAFRERLAPGTYRYALQPVLAGSPGAVPDPCAAPWEDAFCARWKGRPLLSPASESLEHAGRMEDLRSVPWPRDREIRVR